MRHGQDAYAPLPAQEAQSMSINGQTLHHTGSAAEMCRRRGWRPGTRLVGDEGYGPTVIQITAVGDHDILAKTLGHAGAAVAPHEGNWVLWCRDWREATDEDIPTPLIAGQRVRLRSRDLNGTVVCGPDHSGFYRIDCGEDGVWIDAATAYGD